MADQIPARPSKYDPAVLAIAAEELAPEIAKWLEDEMTPRWRADLAKMRWPSDGYEFARELEDRWHISPNYDLVEILEGAYCILDHAWRRAVSEWVSTYGVTLDLEVGARIVISGHGPGDITSRDEKHATYACRPDAEAEKFKNGGGYICTPEMVTAETKAA